MLLIILFIIFAELLSTCTGRRTLTSLILKLLTNVDQDVSDATVLVQVKTDHVVSGTVPGRMMPT